MFSFDTVVIHFYQVIENLKKTAFFSCVMFHYISLNLKRLHTCSLLLVSGDVVVLRAPAICTSFSALAKNITFSLDEADNSLDKPNSLMKSPLEHYVDAHGS